MRLQNQHDLANTFANYLVQQRKKSKVGMIILMSLFAVFIIGGSFIPAHDNTDFMWKMGILGFFALILLFLVYLSFNEGKKYDPDNSPVIKAIKYKNQDGYFTWIYPFKHIYNGIPSYYMVFMTKDKKRYQVNLQTENEFTIINSLQEVITNVTYGFTEEMKQRYKENPGALSVHNRRF